MEIDPLLIKNIEIFYQIRNFLFFKVYLLLFQLSLTFGFIVLVYKIKALSFIIKSYSYNYILNIILNIIFFDLDCLYFL